MMPPRLGTLIAAAALLMGGVRASWAGYALRMNGEEGAGAARVIHADDALLEPAGSFTVEGLVFTTSAVNGLCPSIINKDSQNGYALEVCPTGPSTNNARFNFGGTFGVVTSADIPMNRWVHVAGVYDAAVSGARLYVNGQFAGGAGGVPTPAFASALLYLGNRDAGFSMQGAIDEVRLWNIARTTAAIQADMFKSTGPTTGLVGLWHFDEGSGTTAADASGNGLDGTLVNSPLWVPDSPRAITDLAVSVVSTGLGASSQTVTLSWTAPGDNGDFGQLNGSTYSVRWATFPMASEAAYSIANYSLDVVTYTVIPGSRQTLTFTLDPLTTWYFVVKTTDALSFASSLSNAATAQSYFWAPAATAGNSWAVAWGDYDNDGDLDALVANYNSQDEVVLRNDGGGMFTKLTLAGTGGNSTGVAWGDYDNDGDLDAIVANAGGEDEFLLRNDGGGVLTKVALTGTGGNSRAVVWGDYNNDGRLDALVANAGGEDEVLLRNDGGGTFTKVTLTGTAGNSVAAAWGDYDNDGDLDAIVANAGVEDEVLLRNDGGGIFSTVTLTGTGGASYSVAWGDYDNDGDLDALVANLAAEDEVLLRNDGGGTFTKITLTGTGGYSDGIAWGDYDGDGDLDALVANGVAEDEVLLRNDGGGTLTKVTLTGTAGNSLAVAWGDYDNDGDLDALLANYDNKDELLLRNDLAVSTAAPSVPSAGFAASWSEDSVGSSSGTLTLQWTAATDNTTPAAALLYRVRVGTNSAGSEYLRIPAANSERGRSRVFADRLSAAQPGIRLSSVPKNGVFYWAVAAEDAGYARSAESAQQSLNLTPPSAVVITAAQDSTVETSSSTWVSITFTAPGEDAGAGDLGSAAVYDVRWTSAGAIDSNAKYIAAPNQRLVSAQGTAGAPVTVLVPVVPGKTWYFALTTKDSYGSRSALSNSQSVFARIMLEAVHDAAAFSVLQGQTTSFLRLRLWTEGTGNTQSLAKVAVRKFGTLPDAAISNVGLYLDSGGDEAFTSGDLTGLKSSPAVFVSSRATLTLPVPENIQNSTRTYFVAATIRSDYLPVEGDSVSLRLDGEALTVTGGGVDAVDFPAMSFDGIDDRLNTGYNLAIDAQTQVTVEAWVRSTDTARANAAIVSRGVNGGNNGYRLWLGAGGCSAGVPSFFVGSSVLCAADASGQRVVTDGRWHHVAAVFNAGAGQIFLDGVGLSTGSMGGTLADAASDLSIGGPNSSGGAVPFLGQMDEVRVANFVRYPAELPPARRNVQAGAAVLYHFDGLAADGFAADSSVNALVTASEGQAKGYARSTGTAVTDASDTLFVQAASLLPSALFRNDTNVPVMSLKLWTGGDFITVGQLAVTSTGTAANNSVSTLKLYKDNGDGLFNTASDTLLTPGGVDFAVVAATFTALAQTIDASTKTYFVSWNVTGSAENTKSIGLILPSTAAFTLSGSTDTVFSGNFPIAPGTAPIVAAQALVTAEPSTGTWLNVSSTVFQAAFGAGNISYVKWRWDRSPATQVDDTEPVSWSAGKTTVTATSDNNDWYFHARAFDVFSSSGTQVDLGPFWLDRTAPVAASFASLDSLGAPLGEALFNDLASAVTAQLTVSDAASGLNLDGPAPFAASSGTVSLWHFDEASGNWADAGPAGNTLTASGAGRGAGRFDAGLSLSSASWAQNASPASLPTGNAARTVEAWVNLASTQGVQGLVSWGAGGASGFNRFQVSGRRLGADFGGASVRFSPDLSTGAWHHVAMTWDGAEARFYADGVRIGTQAFGAQSTGAGTLYVGATDLGAGLRGGLDEVRILSYAKTEAELAASALRGDPYYVTYSTDTGRSWKVVNATVPSAGSYVELQAAHGAAGPSSLLARGLDLVVSTWTQTGALGTNQVRFHFADLAGNVKTAGPFSVLVDTNAPVAVSTPSLPSPGTYTGPRPDFYWAGPSTALVQGLGGQFFLQVSSADAAFAAPNIIISISTPALVSDALFSRVTGVYVSTFPALGAGTTYYWRVRSKSSLGVFGPWGPAYGFVVDVTTPAVSSFIVNNSTGGVFGETGPIDLLSGATVQLSASDALSGLGQALSLSTAPGTLAYWRFSERDGGAPNDEAQGLAGALGCFGACQNPRYAPTPFGAGLRLASNQYLSAANGSFQFPPASTFTVSAWIKPASVTGINQVIAGLGAPLTSPGSNWVLYVNSLGALRLTNATGGGALSPNGLIQAGAWQHVTAVQKGTRVWLYVNGVLRHSESTGQPNSGGGTMPFSVGAGFRADGVTPEGFFTGDIDEVKVLGYAADSQEVAADYARGVPGRFCVEYSTTAGAAWNVVSATFPAAGFPYVSQTGADGATGAETIIVKDLVLTHSTTTATGAAGTNLLRVLAADRKGNFTLAGPFTVIVDTVAAAAVSTPTLPSPGVFVSTRPSFAWDGPSTATAAGMGSAASFLLEVDDQSDFSSPAVAISTPVVVVSSAATFTRGVYVSTFSLAHGTTYYWRVRARDWLNVASPALTVSSFVTDFSSPVASAFATINSTGGYTGEAVGLSLASGVTAQMTLADSGPAGLALSPLADGAVPYGVMYTTQGAQALPLWQDGTWGTALADAAQTDFRVLARHQGSLWGATATGRVWSYDGAVWGLSTNLGQSVLALESFGGKLYAGLNANGQVHSYNGVSWSLEASFGGVAVRALKSYGGRLYAGDSAGRVWGYEPTKAQWFLSFQSTSSVVESLAVYDGRLFAGANPNVYAFNGSTWTASFAVGAAVNAMAAYDGKLYAATNNSGIVYQFDGAVWSVSYDPPETASDALAVHAGRLYAASALPSNGRVYAFDGKSWALVRTLPSLNDRVLALAPFSGRLYAGLSEASGDAQVLVSTPLAVSLTGAEGSVAPQTLSVTSLNLAASAAGTLCAGSASCTATNQVRFTATDRAGRVGQAGPFAILVDALLSQPTAYSPAPARYMRETLPDFAWVEASTMPKHTVQVSTGADFSAMIVNSLTLNSPFASPTSLTNGTTYFWRVRALNAFDVASSFSDPVNFTVDVNPPSTSAYQHSNSTGGVLAESQMTNLAVGATVQLTVLDPLAGLNPVPLPSRERVGAWTFEGTGATVYDLSGQGLGGRLGSASLRGTGYQGGGLTFPVGLTGMAISTSPVGSWTGLTAAAWVKVSANNTLSQTVLASKHFRFQADSAQGRVRFRMDAAATGGCSLATPMSYPLGSWVHLALVLDPGATRNRVFVNGDTAAECVGTAVLSDTPFTVGIDTVSALGGTDVFNGSLDELRIFSAPLSTAPVREEMAGSPFSVLYSTTAGATWSAAASTGPAGPRLSFSAVPGSLALEALRVVDLPLHESSSAVLCAQVSPCAATNQVVYYVPDRAGGVRTAGPFAVVVDTSVPLPLLTSLTPLSTDTLHATAAATDNLAGVKDLLFEASTSAAFALPLSSSGFVAQSTWSFTGLIDATTYFVRVWTRDNLLNVSTPSVASSSATFGTVFFTTASAVPASALQGAFVPMATLKLATKQAATSRLLGLRVRKTGSIPDSDITQAQLYSDSDGDGVYSGGDTLQAFGTLALNEAQLTLAGQGAPLDVLVSTFHVVFKLAPGAITNNTVGLEISSTTSVSLKHPGRAEGTFPVTAGPLVVTDGANFLNITPANLAPSAITPGVDNIPVLELRSQTDTGTSIVSSVTVTMSGTTPTSKIRSVNLWRDADPEDGIFDANTDIRMTGDADNFGIQTVATMSVAGFDVSSRTVTTSPRRFFVTVSLAADAPQDTSFQLALPATTSVILQNLADTVSFSTTVITSTVGVILNNTITVSAIDETPAVFVQGERFAVLRVTATVDQGAAQVNRFTLRLTGNGQSSDIDAVEVWKDATVDGKSLNANLDVRVGSAAYVAGLATVDISTQTLVAGTSSVFFLAYVLDPAAAPGVTLGAKLNDGDIRAGNSGTTVSGTFPIESSSRTVQATVNRMLILNAIKDISPGALLQGQQHAAMLRLDVISDKNDFSWLGLSVERLGTAPDSAVSAVNVYRDFDGNGLFDVAVDSRLSSGADAFAASTANLTMLQVQTVTQSTRSYFVTLSVAANATPGQTLGVRISSTASFNLLAPNALSTATALPIQTGVVPVSQFQNTITVSTASIVPALGAEPGTTDVALMSLTMKTDVSNAVWQSLRVDQAGTAADSDVKAVKLYYDFNDVGTFDSSNLVQYSSVSFSTQTFGGNGPGSVILNFTGPQTLGTAAKRYFLVVDLSTGATPARTLIVRASTGAFFTVNAPNQVVPSASFTSAALTINAPPVTMGVVGASSAPATAVQGTPNIVMLAFKARTNAYSARWTQLRVTRTGTGADADVTAVKLYRDADGTGTLDIVSDERISTGTFSGGTVLLAFSTQTITVATQTYFVTFDLRTTAAAGNTVGARIAAAGDLKVESPDTVDTAGFPLQSGAAAVVATQSGLFVTPTNMAPGELKQGATEQVLLSLALQTTQYALSWSALTVRSTGSASDSDIKALSVWLDANLNGAVDIGTDTKITSGLNAFLGGTAVLSLSQVQDIGTAQKRYLITADIAAFAEPGRTFAVILTSTAAFSVSAPNFIVNSGFPAQSDANATLRKLEESLLLTPTDLVGAGVNQGANVALAKLAVRASRNRVGWTALNIRQNGNLGAGEIDSVGIWRDSNGDGQLSSADLLVGSAAFSGSQAAVAFSSAQTVGASTQTYFLAVQPNISATVGADIRLSVQSVDFSITSPDAVAATNLPFNTASAVVLDAKTPSLPVVTDAGSYSSDFEGLSFSWSSSVGTGTLSGAFYAVGTTPGGTDVRSWTAVSAALTSVRATGFPLTQATTYYVSVKTQSSFGFDSPVGVSDGVLMDFQSPIKPAITVSAGSGALLVTWTSVPGGPSGILGYLIEYRTGASPQWINAKTGEKTSVKALSRPAAGGAAPADFSVLAVSSSALATGTSFQASGLPAGTLLVRVSAVTGSGVLSGASDETKVQLGPLPTDGISNASVYPNPFDSRKTSGKIHYVLSANAEVSIRVYSVFGRLIREMSFAPGSTGGLAGSNTVSWDGSDDSGAKVSKGLYLLVLQSGGAKVIVKTGVIH
ncbi:MAG: VCBS repeat-containing protein [Elusimicrobia bacterium]|nr:VCBS repeat-containing protein [Elusimicrobiota bacterium]